MNNLIKNLILTGAALVFIVVFFVYSEIDRAQGLIDIAQNPSMSTARGFEDAESEYETGSANFKHFNGEYLGVGRQTIEALDDQQSTVQFFICVVGKLTESIALNIGNYEYNEYYVLAYNTRLKTLLSKEANE